MESFTIFSAISPYHISTELDCYNLKLIYRLPGALPIKLRLRILENLEVLRIEPLKCLEKMFNSHLAILKKHFDNSTKNLEKVISKTLKENPTLYDFVNSSSYLLSIAISFSSDAILPLRSFLLIHFTA